MKPEQLANPLKSDYAKWQDIVQASGAKVE